MTIILFNIQNTSYNGGDIMKKKLTKALAFIGAMTVLDNAVRVHYTVDLDTNEVLSDMEVNVLGYTVAKIPKDSAFVECVNIGRNFLNTH